jgi:hypothetical protein
VICGERFYDRARKMHRCTRPEHPEGEAHASDAADEWVMTDVEMRRELDAIAEMVGGHEVFHGALVRSLGGSILEGERCTVTVYNVDDKTSRVVDLGPRRRT